MILCSVIPASSNECFSMDKKLCKSSTCLDKEAIFGWSVEREREREREREKISLILAYWYNYIIFRINKY